MGFVDNLVQTESTKMASTTNCCHSEEKLGRLVMDNNDDDDGTPPPPSPPPRRAPPPPPPKRQKFFAVRDFPPGCGRFAPSIVSTPNGEAVYGGGGTVENSVGQDNGIGTSGTGFGPQPLMVSGIDHLETKGEEQSVVSTDQPNGLESLNVEPVKMLVPEGLDAQVVDQLVKALECETPVDELSDLCTVDVVNALLGKKSQPKYPPRRRISAVRDFPPFCGRNAPPLPKEESASVNAAMVIRSLGQKKSDVEENPMKEMVTTEVTQVGDGFLDEDARGSRLERNVSTLTGNKAQTESKGPDTNEVVRNQDEFGAPSENEMEVVPRDIEAGGIKSPGESIQNQCGQTFEVVPNSGNRDIGGLEENLGKELVVYVEKNGSEIKLSDLSGCKNSMFEEDFEHLKNASGRSVVRGLMAARNCPWKRGKEACKPSNMPTSTSEREGEKNNFKLLERPKSAFRTERNEVEKGTCSKNNSSPLRKVHQGISQMVERNEKNYVQHGGVCHDFKMVRKSHNFSVNLPPSHPSSSGSKNVDNDAIVTRSKVRETLRVFQAVYRKLLQEEEAKSKERGHTLRRVDLQASKILKEKGKYVNVGKQIMGSVPGVEVGDEFNYRVELTIIGLHRQIQGGIDYVKQGGKILATSIVSSGSYDDDTDNSDVLIYTGAGGNMMHADKEPEDQKLERGNLALKNSMDAQNPVRVIRGDTKVSDSSDTRARTYIYDGLYLVEKYWQEMGSHGKLVFKFKLVRIPDQPELAWKVVKKSKKFKVREGICIDDISQGKEKFPICAVNTLDEEKPPPFKYITQLIYPNWYHPSLSNECNCTNGCSELGKCTCVAKNGGEIPFNHNGAIVEAKPLVYECGPSCKCPPSCYNRVSQLGIRFQLEIFKTETRGWGVRSLNSIPSGSFICEYAGELLEEKEAEQRTGNDEYLFDIGNNYNDGSLWNGLSNVMPEAHSRSCEVVGSGYFTIDAAQYGNVGRFINHSCSPNLYAQNVLYDHEEKRIPHIMLFAVENIPPLQELTYHYNYMMDQVLDSDGNIRKKSCHCGSFECTGRMY